MSERIREKIEEMIDDTIMDLIIHLEQVCDALQRLERYGVEHFVLSVGFEYKGYKTVRGILEKMLTDLINRLRAEEKVYKMGGDADGGEGE